MTIGSLIQWTSSSTQKISEQPPNGTLSQGTHNLWRDQVSDGGHHGGFLTSPYTFPAMSLFHFLLPDDESCPMSLAMSLAFSWHYDNTCLISSLASSQCRRDTKGVSLPERYIDNTFSILRLCFAYGVSVMFASVCLLHCISIFGPWQKDHDGWVKGCLTTTIKLFKCSLILLSNI